MRLKHLRELALLTQEALARLLGVTPMTVWRWENGERNPSLDVLKNIARILECSVDERLQSAR